MKPCSVACVLGFVLVLPLACAGSADPDVDTAAGGAARAGGGGGSGAAGAGGGGSGGAAGAGGAGAGGGGAAGSGAAAGAAACTLPVVSAGAGGKPPCADEPVPLVPKGQCRPPTDNECDGQCIPGSVPEGTTGNGFDDDCDGLVDEGCACDAGATKPCWLVPSTQTLGPTHEVLGWCNPNAKGKLACGSTAGASTWSGTCVGALVPPAESS